MTDYQYKERKVTTLAAVEDEAGVDQEPVLADAVLISQSSMPPDLQVEDLDEETGELDDSAGLPAGGGARYQGTLVVRGAGTAGTAPKGAAFYRGAGLGETLLAADITGTAQAGSASSITLDAGDTLTDDEAVGMVIEITAGTGAGQAPRVISGNVGATKVVSVRPNFAVTPDATSVYAIRKCAVYRAANTDLETVTIYRYLERRDGDDPRLQKLIGAAGNLRFELPVGRVPKATIDFRGKYRKPVDIASPGKPDFSGNLAVPFMKAQCFLGPTAIKLNTLGIDLGNRAELGDDPADEFGVEVADIDGRRTLVTLNPPFSDVASRDAASDFLNGTESFAWAAWGDTAGKRFSFYCPRLIPRTPGEEQRDRGRLREGLTAQAVGFMMCIF